MNWLQPLLEVIFLGLVPLVLINSGIIRGAYRFGVLAAAGLLMIIDALIFQVPLHELGIRVDNLSSVAPWYIGLAVGAVLFIILFTRIKGIAPLPKWWKDSHFWFWFIPISIGQQFIFFGFLQSRLQSFSPPVIAIAVSAVIFASAHLMYRPRRQAFAVTGLAGLCFAILYVLAPNLIAGSITHMVLNVAAVQRNLFSFPTQKIQ